MQIDRSTGAGTRLMPAAVALLMVVTASQAWADLRAGAEAYQRGDYTTALTEFRALAQQANAGAQNNLATMLLEGAIEDGARVTVSAGADGLEINGKAVSAEAA